MADNHVDYLLFTSWIGIRTEYGVSLDPLHISQLSDYPFHFSCSAVCWRSFGSIRVRMDDFFLSFIFPPFPEIYFVVRFRSFLYFFGLNLWFIFLCLFYLFCVWFFYLGTRLRFHVLLVDSCGFSFFPKICLLTANFFRWVFFRGSWFGFLRPVLGGWWIIFCDDIVSESGLKSSSAKVRIKEKAKLFCYWARFYIDSHEPWVMS